MALCEVEITEDSLIIYIHGVDKRLGSNEWTFWDVHTLDKAVTIHTTHENYDRIIIQTEDPESTMARIQVAIAGRTPA
ncbi:MAG TPA: hypothetical protein VKY74_12670 [Chloroflexia bacterium]|nr:hypothetical protein [Chloroflexia bacterium]